MSDPGARPRYEHVAALASGGMGRVTLARRAGDPSAPLVAVKTMHPHLRDDPEAVQRFAREAELGSALHHPNVIELLDRGNDEDGRPFLVMEYFPSETLAALLTRVARKKLRVPVPVAVRVITDALAGLHAVHESRGADGAPLGLVHRDFSPQNILVGENGLTRLADLGIAKGTRSAALTRVGAVRGKSGYLSPEQALGGRLDRRSDVFSAGIVLYELLTSRPLFHAATEDEAIQRLLRKPVPDPRERAPDCPPALVAAVLRALERDPARRPASASAFRSAILDGVSTAGVADEATVAAFVSAELGDRIHARRAAVEAAVALKNAAAEGTSSEGAGKMLAETEGGLVPALDDADDDDGDASGTGGEGSGLSRASTMCIALATVVLTGALAWWFSR